jgi:hypothetical protein
MDKQINGHRGHRGTQRIQIKFRPHTKTQRKNIQTGFTGFINRQKEEDRRK